VRGGAHRRRAFLPRHAWQAERPAHVPYSFGPVASFAASVVERAVVRLSAPRTKPSPCVCQFRRMSSSVLARRRTCGATSLVSLPQRRVPRTRLAAERLGDRWHGRSCAPPPARKTGGTTGIPGTVLAVKPLPRKNRASTSLTVRVICADTSMKAESTNVVTVQPIDKPWARRDGVGGWWPLPLGMSQYGGPREMTTTTTGRVFILRTVCRCLLTAAKASLSMSTAYFGTFQTAQSWLTLPLARAG
jgi:hypothetical protein